MDRLQLLHPPFPTATVNKAISDRPYGGTRYPASWRFTAMGLRPTAVANWHTARCWYDMHTYIRSNMVFSFK